jgi:hypothetical protein
MNMVLALPVLGLIPIGEHSLGVPIKDGSVQIGFHDTPDSFDRLNVTAAPDEIQIARKGGDLQVESAVLHKAENGKRGGKRVHVFVAPEPVLTIRKIDGQWMTEADKIASRLGLVRFMAKVGEVAVGKSKRAQSQHRR